MHTPLLNAAAVRRWCRRTADALDRSRAGIDALNVFPVPDFDTGTNLHLTMQAAAAGVDRLPADADVATMWRALTGGALIGARGNSGVILSAILRGMAEVLGDGGGLAGALRRASSFADQSVSDPVAGTMLSVLRAAADACPETGDPATVTRLVAERAREALPRTTEQLPVLAREGVVDAGAVGLCVVLDELAAVAGETSTGSSGEPEAGTPPAAGLPEAALGGTACPSDRGRTGEGAATDEHGPYEVMYLLDADESSARSRCSANRRRDVRPRSSVRPSAGRPPRWCR